MGSTGFRIWMLRSAEIPLSPFRSIRNAATIVADLGRGRRRRKGEEGERGTRGRKKPRRGRRIARGTRERRG